MKCPHCKDTSLVMSERQGVEIDYCPDCRGIWLDRGELDKILDRQRKEMDTAPAQTQTPPPVQEQHHHYAPSGYYQKPYKRKKSFLEELFD